MTNKFLPEEQITENDFYFLCYITAMTAGQIGQTATRDEETADLFRQLAERMIEQAGK